MEMSTAPLGQCLATLRVKAGLSQEELASLIHKSKEHISRIETGRVQVPRDETIEAIVAALHDKLPDDWVEQLSGLRQTWGRLAEDRRLRQINRHSPVIHGTLRFGSGVAPSRLEQARLLHELRGKLAEVQELVNALLKVEGAE